MSRFAGRSPSGSTIRPPFGSATTGRSNISFPAWTGPPGSAGPPPTVAGARLHLSAEPPRHSCRPSIDVLFDSLAADAGAQVLAGLLTGMGRDGAAGLLAIRRAGGFTLAQDEATSVVYGMPREAVLVGGAQAVLPLERIGPEILRLLDGGERGLP